MELQIPPSHHRKSILSPEGGNVLRVKLDTVGTGLEQDSEVLIDQIRALDNQRLLQRLGKIGPEQSAELLWKLKAILDI